MSKSIKKSQWEKTPDTLIVWDINKIPTKEQIEKSINYLTELKSKSYNYNLFNEFWVNNIERLLTNPLWKSISKIGSVENGWFRLNYKSKERFITPNDSWDTIEYICKTLLKV